MIEYKGYTGVIEYRPEEEAFHGIVANIRDVISFYGTSVEELKEAMAQAVDDYLEYCKGRGIEPAKPYSGRFNVRMSAEQHRAVAMAAASSGKSMNDWVVEKLEQASSSSAEGARPVRTAKKRRSA
jgi:predicted HicB family RNase H-like nuclease